jgi:hypothetical protein
MMSSRLAQRNSRMPEFECIRGNPNRVENSSKYVAGQRLCQSQPGITKGFRTKSFPLSGIAGTV